MFALFLIVWYDSLLGRAVARPLVPQIRLGCLSSISFKS